MSQFLSLIHKFSVLSSMQLFITEGSISLYTIWHFCLESTAQHIALTHSVSHLIIAACIECATVLQA